jgi:hypothetical protein
MPGIMMDLSGSAYLYAVALLAVAFLNDPTAIAVDAVIPHTFLDYSG